MKIPRSIAGRVSFPLRISLLFRGQYVQPVSPLSRHGVLEEDRPFVDDSAVIGDLSALVSATVVGLIAEVRELDGSPAKSRRSDEYRWFVCVAGPVNEGVFC